MKVKIGIIGAGSISEYHIRGFQKLKDVEVAALCDSNKTRASEMALKYGIKFVYEKAEDMLADDRIDAVTICVWNKLHADLSIQALQQGKHVLCEKPMALNAAEAEKMLKAEEESGKLLMLGLVRRFDAKTEAAKGIVSGGELGNIYYAKAAYLRRDGQPGGWFSDKSKSGGGALIDIGIHSLDLLLYLIDAGRVDSVSGKVFHFPDMMIGIKGADKYESRDTGKIHNVEDMVIATITFSDGTILNLEASWAQHIKDETQYMEIYGELGGLIVDPDLVLYSNKNGFMTDKTFNTGTNEGDAFQMMFDAEMAHFRDCIIKGTECRSPSTEALELMKIIDAIYRSAELGKPVYL
jgi:predicted dehydrogenase